MPHRDTNTDDRPTTRRRVLASLSAATTGGVLTTTAVAADDQGDDFCRYDNSLLVRSQPNEILYKFTPTHGVETKNGRRLDDVKRTHRADFTYAGQAEHFWFSGQGRAYIDQTAPCGDEDVIGRGREDEIPGGSEDEFCELNQSVSAYVPEAERESATVLFGASHYIEPEDGGQRVPHTTFEVPVGESRAVPYAGWLTAFSLDGPAQVDITQAAPCANPDD